MSDAQPIDLNSGFLGIGRHVSGVADPFNGHIDDFRIAHIQRSDGWIATTYNNMSDPGGFAVAGVEEQEGGTRPPNNSSPYIPTNHQTSPVLTQVSDCTRSAWRNCRSA